PPRLGSRPRQAARARQAGPAPGRRAGGAGHRRVRGPDRGPRRRPQAPGAPGHREGGIRQVRVEGIRSSEDRVAERALPGERRVLEAAQRSLSGESRGIRALLPFLGPAFVAAVAYVDPGNFATNITSGTRYGYTLLWVVLAANLIAMLVQAMSAKLGIATGLNLPEVCRERLPRPVNLLLWLQAEV